MATLEEMVDKAIQVAVKRALLDAHPVGSYFITESADNPHEILGGGYGKNWKGDSCSAQMRRTPLEVREVRLCTL
jgi:hypothetical protein